MYSESSVLNLKVYAWWGNVAGGNAWFVSNNFFVFSSQGSFAQINDKSRDC